VHEIAESGSPKELSFILPTQMVCNLRFLREMDTSTARAQPLQQADGPPIARSIAATPALGEGDADAAGNGLWIPIH